MSTAFILLRAIFALNCIHQLTSAAAVIRKPMHAARTTEDILSRIRNDAMRKRTLSDDHVYSRELACQVDMVGLTGEYYYTETFPGKVCGTYFLGDMDEIVEIEVIEFDASCDDSQVEFFDGWAMAAGLFPAESEHQHPMDERVKSVCSLPSTRRHVFRSTQNVAMLSFKLGHAGNSIRITYKGKKIPNPCNVMAREPSGVFTLRNFGEESNCTFANVYSSKVNVIQMQVGQDTQEAQLKCTGEPDFVQFLAGNTFEPPSMSTEENICGRSGNQILVSETSVDSDLAAFETPCSTGNTLTIPLVCQVSMVRLTSSGQSDNSIHFVYNRLVAPKKQCPLPKVDPTP